MEIMKNGSDGAMGVFGNTKQKPRDSQMKRWCLTLNNWSESEYADIFNFVGVNGAKYIIGKEIGEKNNIPHLQMYIEFREKVRFTQIKKLKGFERTHIEISKGTPDQNYKYCSKDGDFITNIILKEEPIKVMIIEKLLPFQKSLEDIIIGPVNNGKIIWVYDPIGQTGKTQFLRYLNVKYKIPFAYGGKCADIINLAFNNKKYLESINNPCFVYNFGRETQNDKISYNSMEQISDGAIANTKFEAGCFVFNQPHIIVLANCKPIISKLTKSRWIIKTINNNLELVDYIEDDDGDNL
jgi:hypothetical protein